MTTDQRTRDAAGPGPVGVGWAVPGVPPTVDDGPATDVSAAGSGSGAAGASDRGWEAAPVTQATEAGEAAEAAAVRAEAAVAGLREGGGGGSTPGGVHPVTRAVHDCLVALRAARDASTLSLTAEEIAVLLLGVCQILAQCAGLRLRLLTAATAARVAEATGATSTAAWLAHRTQLTRRAASGDLRLARDLDRRYRLLDRALAAGLVSLEQVRVCVSALRRLPKDLPEDALARCQQFLIDAAQSHDTDQLKVRGRQLWAVIDPDGAERREGEELEDEEELARAKAYFRSWRNGDGTTGFRGKLPDAQADMLLKAIQAYAAPRRRSNPNIPTPDPHQTPGDGPGSDGTGTGPAPTTPGPPAAPGRSPDRPPSERRPRPAGPGEPAGSGEAPGEDPFDWRGRPCDAPQAQQSPEERQTGKALPYPVILGHGLIDLLEHLPADALPQAGGMAATVVVTMTLDQLENRLGAATLDTGTTISAAQARRLACQAGVIPMVLGGESQPLDLGRESRTFRKHQRLAMGVRDGWQCIAEGCDRPASWLHAHHPIPWAEGGQTDLDNGCLPCEYHHGLFHSTRWTHERLPDGQIRFTRTRRNRN